MTGKPSADEKKKYQRLIASQQRVSDMARPHASCEVVAARRLSADQAILRGLREPVHFVRIGSRDPT